MKKLLFMTLMAVASVCANAKDLSYEMFLDIYQSMSKSKAKCHLPPKAILDKYGLTMKESQIGYEYWACIGENVYLDSEKMPQTQGTWCIYVNDGENGEHSTLHFSSADACNRLVAQAKSYGLVTMYVDEDYEGGAYKETMAAMNPVKGKITHIKGKNQRKSMGVIGRFVFQEGVNSIDIELGFENLMVVPDDKLSIDNALQIYYYPTNRKEILTSEGYTYRMKIGNTEYWTKECNIRKGGKNEDYTVFGFGKGTSSVVGVTINPGDVNVMIEVFNAKARGDYFKQLEERGAEGYSGYNSLSHGGVYLEYRQGNDKFSISYGYMGSNRTIIGISKYEE